MNVMEANESKVSGGGRGLGFTTSYTPADGAKEVYKALEDGAVSDAPETQVISWWITLKTEGIV